ncbi:ABA_G0057870.mRNA.1.CDS.1 [Saccharomyces cerevisiae]|nr:ABA_G0057870.mRNA.1.CDS.1 [Saccharomyces cerevisiae]CAI6920886.1 ABA_G0057870.mRNA.1.CDS.1 [Saccharomyces cerevisiae]
MGNLIVPFLEFSGTEIKEPNNFITENSNAIETAAASMVIRQGFHPRQYYTVDAFWRGRPIKCNGYLEFYESASKG